MSHYYPSGYAGTPQYYDYSTSASNSPAPDDAYVYAIPPFQTPTGKRHDGRHASYTSPPVYPSPAHFPSASYYETHFDYTSPPVQRYEYVSPQRTSPRRSKREQSPLRYKSRSTQPMFDDGLGDASDYDEHVRPSHHTTHARHSSTSEKKRPMSSADKAFTQTYDDYVETPVRSRARRASAADRQSTPKQSGRSRKAPRAAPREATAADASLYHIPAGYSLKNWDPSEEPILLLGSAFDSNSLGKWIYDWTVYHHGGNTPIPGVAGDLWLLLIKFSGRMKRIQECIPRVSSRDNKKLLSEFLRSGDRIWGKIKELLAQCEEYMWKGAKKDGNKISMGEKSGVEFVKTMFGAYREMDKTEKLMTSLRLWTMRFEANCDELIRRPKEN